MTNYRIILSCLGIILCTFSQAQVIDNTSSVKNNESNKYFRFHYDNDYFTATDEYYTQGITLEFVHPVLKNNPLNKLLLKPKNSDAKYGIRFDHFGYTPTSIRSEFIRYGDRPFSGNIAVSSFLMAIDTLKHQRLSTTLTLGIIGSKAGGREMQVKIHEWLKNITPLGWEYQIANDVILNYQINYEKALYQYRNRFIINSLSELRVGAHTDKIKTGFNFMVGNIPNSYAANAQNQSTKKKFRFYVYGQLQPGFTVYDATLQGGVFNKTSPYTLAAKDLTRLTLQGDFGAVMKIRKLTLEYCQSFITKEFETGKLHRWGGVRLGVLF